MKKFAYFLFISVVLFTGCKKDKSDNNPAGPSYQIQTGTAGNIGNSEATFTGGLTSVSGKNILSYGHVWSTSPHPTTALPSKTTFGPTSRDTAFTSTLTRLRQGAVIFVR
ncbi:MAG TPA: hypothetical protein PKG48_08245, partial [Bacteroidales bacterium]|nr:hypothetical protein [Bacteroidales bacterium]